MNDRTTASAEVKGRGNLTSDGLDDNYAELVVAIITQAVKDYETVFFGLYSELDPLTRMKLYQQKAEIETFFHSDWFEAICDLDGPYLLRRSREIIKRSLKVKIHKDNRARLNI